MTAAAAAVCFISRHFLFAELADRHLLLDGISAVHALDKRFGKPKKTVISQRDVPGVTRGADWSDDFFEQKMLSVL